MLKSFKKYMIVILFIILTYAWVWMGTYFRTKKYYKQACMNYDDEKYMIALKGERILNESQSGYIFQGGFQQVMEAWNNPFALPKPSIYTNSIKMIDNIINFKIDIAEGQKIFKTYFKMDNKFLPEVLLRIGDLQFDQGQTDKSIETYQLIINAFGHNKEIAELAKSKLNKLIK